jgi:L-threonylcarbamoyladenylate synthase
MRKATSNKLRQAVKILKQGGVIAFPTETVYGIGALLSQKRAVRKIYQIKNRPRSKPLQILVANLRQAKELGRFSAQALSFAQKHWPGPLTLVVPKTNKVPKLVTAGTNKVGLRIPAHSLTLRLLRRCGPLAATSANLSGEKPFLTPQEVKKNLPKVDYILPGRVKLGKASKVVDATKGFKVLRA